MSTCTHTHTQTHKHTHTNSNTYNESPHPELLTHPPDATASVRAARRELAAFRLVLRTV